MTNLWPRPRRTTGSGPPPNMRFGEFAYSDADGLIHVGRPDGTVRSFGSSGSTDPAHTHNYAPADHSHPEYALAGHGHGAIVIPLTPINGFQPLAGWANELRVYPSLGLALLRFGFSSPTPVNAAVLAWSPTYAAQLHTPNYISSQGGIPNRADTLLFIDGASLAWFSPSGDPLDYVAGSGVFTYA